MNPKKGRKRPVREKNKRNKDAFLNALCNFFKRRSNKQGMVMDSFTPEGIPVSSPLNLGMSLTETDAY